MIRNEILDEDILLPTVTDWTYRVPSAGRFEVRICQVVLEALETAGAEATWCDGGSFNQIFT